jgi:hypothetical protein
MVVDLVITLATPALIYSNDVDQFGREVEYHPLSPSFEFYCETDANANDGGEDDDEVKRS